MTANRYKVSAAFDFPVWKPISPAFERVRLHSLSSGCFSCHIQDIPSLCHMAAEAATTLNTF